MIKSEGAFLTPLRFWGASAGMRGAPDFLPDKSRLTAKYDGKRLANGIYVCYTGKT